MAAGDPLAITNTKITTLNAVQVLTKVTADQTADATAQNFVYTPTGRDGKLLFIIHQGAASVVVYTVAAGARTFAGAAAATTTAATAGTYVLQVETGKHIQADGTVVLSALPTTGKDLVNDHAMTVGVVELQ